MVVITNEFASKHFCNISQEFTYSSGVCFCDFFGWAIWNFYSDNEVYKNIDWMQNIIFPCSQGHVFWAVFYYCKCYSTTFLSRQNRCHAWCPILFEILYGKLFSLKELCHFLQSSAFRNNFSNPGMLYRISQLFEYCGSVQAMLTANRCLVILVFSLTI